MLCIVYGIFKIQFNHFFLLVKPKSHCPTKALSPTKSQEKKRGIYTKITWATTPPPTFTMNQNDPPYPSRWTARTRTCGLLHDLREGYQPPITS